MDGQGRRPDVVLALPLDYLFSTMPLFTVQTECILELGYADSTTHFSSIPMHLVTLTVPSTISNFTISHAAPGYDPQKLRHCQIQELRLEFFYRKPPQIRVGLVANRQEVTFIADDYLLPHLTIPAGIPPLELVIGRFTSALQVLRPNCRHWRRTVDELAATLHFSHHSYRSSSGFILWLVKDNYAAVCTVLPMFILLYRLMWKVISLKIVFQG